MDGRNAQSNDGACFLLLLGSSLGDLEQDNSLGDVSSMGMRGTGDGVTKRPALAEAGVARKCFSTLASGERLSGILCEVEK